MTSITGTWDLVIKTPIGKQHVVLDLAETDGVLTGQAIGTDETVPLVEPTLTGNRLSWRQQITKPLRLNLVFDVTIDGDTLTGTSKAGRLPRSRVTGTRSTRRLPT
jgi:hypothetical protein